MFKENIVIDCELYKNQLGELCAEKDYLQEAIDSNLLNDRAYSVIKNKLKGINNKILTTEAKIKLLNNKQKKDLKNA